MPSPSNKKLLLLYIYNILRECSDEEHPLKQQDISDRILSTYGMESERKAISANLLCLEDCGFDIITLPNKGVYLGRREFEPSEISFLVDAVFSSKEINSRQAQQLAEKLFSGFSVHQRKRYRYVYKADQISRSDNRQIFYIIDTLTFAIEQKKRVSFEYASYTVDGKSGRPAKVSPYFLVNSNGKYYLVCSRHRAWGLANYRIERMENIRILDEAAAPIEQVKGYTADFDITKYANENIYMFGGQSVYADILIKDENVLAYIYDWFGRDVTVRKNGDEISVTVHANEKALTYWLLQYGEIAEITSPESTRRKVTGMVAKLAQTYHITGD